MIMQNYFKCFFNKKVFDDDKKKLSIGQKFCANVKFTT